MTNITASTTRTETVAQLVIRAQGGDRDAMGELFNRYRQHVFAIALRRLGDENEAQELCQEVGKTVPPRKRVN